MHLKPGDLLYSKKSLSTYYVGHIAILGEDGLVYHSFPNKDGKVKDSLTYYLSRLRPEDYALIIRPYNKEYAKSAAKVVGQVYEKVKKYRFNPKLSNITSNYCTKLIWQIFYLGNNGLDILNKNYHWDKHAFIFPHEFLKTHHLYQVGKLNGLRRSISSKDQLTIPPV